LVGAAKLGWFINGDGKFSLDMLLAKAETANLGIGSGSSFPGTGDMPMGLWRWQNLQLHGQSEI
jgi:hypothetical protein